MEFINTNQIIKELKSTSGKDFLNKLTLELHKKIGAEFTFIARLDRVRLTSQTLSFVYQDKIQDNFEYALMDSPCADVSRNNTCIFPVHICDLYPKDQLLIDMAIEGYVGAPLHNSKGEVFGLVVALYRQEIKKAKYFAALFELFSGRIAAELDRLDKEVALKEINETLESKVKARTQELEETIKCLKDSQQQLIEQEKLASLGRIVAGVAHEINTPVGASLLGNSMLNEKVKELHQKLYSEKLSKKYLESYIQNTLITIDGINFNLTRTCELIDNFKKLARDFHTDEHYEIVLTDWIFSLTNSLQPIFKKHRIKYSLHLPDNEILIDTYPSHLAQVITNIVMNAINHAYPKRSENKELAISISGNSSKYNIEIQDNGVGMDEDTKSKIFEPFFSTKRYAGGMGLGMSIVYNLVVDSLNGRVTIDSKEDKGTKVRLIFGD